MYQYRARVVRVVDGDTIDLRIDLGLYVFKSERVRLYGINTPETRTKDLVEKEAGLRAKRWVVSLLMDKWKGLVIVDTKKDARGKFGRILALIRPPDDEAAKLIQQETVNDALVELGMAEKYFGGRR